MTAYKLDDMPKYHQFQKGKEREALDFIMEGINLQLHKTVEMNIYGLLLTVNKGAENEFTFQIFDGDYIVRDPSKMLQFCIVPERKSSGVPLGKWSYALTEDGPFYGDYDTREEAVEDAKEEVEEIGESFPSVYVGIIAPVDLKIDTDFILERLKESAEEQVGELASDYLTDVSRTDFNNLDSRLQVVVDDWISRKYPPNFWTVELVTEEDIS